jgi:hypothetical protein
MNPIRRCFLAALSGLALAAAAHAQPGAADPRIPDSLRPWEGWATWGNHERFCPPVYNDFGTRMCLWPGRLDLTVDADGGGFRIAGRMAAAGWFPLPGDKDHWPLGVSVDGREVPVMGRDGVPSVRLGPGDHTVSGRYAWEGVPQRLRLPSEYGLVSLVLSGEPVARPSWDPSGFLWLKRDAPTGEADRDFLGVNVYALLEDGIPMWLRLEVEMTVSGKSREEELGAVLPAGWRLASIECPVPVLVDEDGRMRAQVRAGRWVARIAAFRIDNPAALSFSEGVRPAVAQALLGLRANPGFRTIEITGAPPVDVSQTTFPPAWRKFPVFQWNTAESLEINERVRGMGDRRPAGLRISREWWLDESGQGFTFRDTISGAMQEIWRLDAAPGQDLGAVRSDGQGQLITLDPETGTPGVEIRTRSISLEATGRMPRAASIPATGWNADADGLDVTLNLPPGWRLLALFGADSVRGDWLTQWTLLDLFLLLIFSLAVFRLWGFGPSVLAFVAFGLTYHEPGAPTVLWLLLLIPLALLRVVPAGWGRRLVMVWKWATVVALILVLAPFVAAQVQQGLYPQLEKIKSHPVPFAAYERSSIDAREEAASVVAGLAAVPQADASKSARSRILPYSSAPLGKGGQSQNLQFEAGARIQTGPGVPDWTWRTVSFGWNGPVTPAQQVRLLLVPMPVERLLSFLRVILLVALGYMLLRRIRHGAGVAGPVAFALLLLAAPTGAHAQFPGPQMLDTLRDRLLEAPDAFPHAAEIPSVSLRLDGLELSIEAEIHAAARVAVPLPARLPAWTPLSVTVDGRPTAALRRGDGSLWVVLEEGVRRVGMRGLLADVNEWEWSFQLRPRTVSIDAPGWTVAGVRPGGIPEQQVFFSRIETDGSGGATYERQEVETVAVVERRIELGLVWQVNTSVRRLSPPGRALALRVPLITGENVVTTGAVVREGAIEVRLGATQDSFSWQSELTPRPSIELSSRQSDPWVERWILTVSPVWNVALSGLAPVFEPENPGLVPVWTPWPGEGALLEISRPEALAGATATVRKVRHEVSTGKRQRAASLNLSVLTSLGEDFAIQLPGSAEITSLTLNGTGIPVRRSESSIIVPLAPGEQEVALAWKIDVPLAFHVSTDAVRLPVAAANIETVIRPPSSRWILWTDGPLRGPAVRFWTVLACSLLAALVLGRLPVSPLKTHEWVLLALGLTQVPLGAALAVVGWFFLMAWRGRDSCRKLPAPVFNITQIAVAVVTVVALAVFVAVVAAGLLGNPKMFITGNGSSPDVLRWYQAQSDGPLPEPALASVSIWWYRFLMLLWALWLAASLVRWLRWGWNQFSSGGLLRMAPRGTAQPDGPKPTPPDLPPQPPT